VYRHLCLWLINGIHHLALKGLGTLFVAGYISLAEGEKDPRNLIVSFAIVRVLLIEFDVTSQIDVCIIISSFA
jgi:hypothetical protein